MPDRRMHRGPHPQDHELFKPAALPGLRAATADLSWLLGRGYTANAALKLTGDRYQLTARQRSAVLRCACTEGQRDARRTRQLGAEQLRDQPLDIDGFNVLTTLEVALSGGVVLIGRDGVMRDIAGVHGSYRSVEETEGAIALLADFTQAWGVGAVQLYLDQPVSNSGRLRAHLSDVARQRRLPWQTHVVADPDKLLAQSPRVVASADAQILDAALRWTNLARDCVRGSLPGAFIIDLSHAP